jgi:DNA mismatch endonuclease (patch repair protein)
MTGLSIRARAPSASSLKTRHVMQANRSRDTAPEVRLRRLLFASGLRFRKNCRPEPTLRCKADIVFPRPRVCVFIDGCFWHSCPRHFKLPKTNAAWWAEKMHANVQRDGRQTRTLKGRGWCVIRLWEHELSGRGAYECLDRLREVMRNR